MNRTEGSTSESYLQPKRPKTVITGVLLIETGVASLRQQNLDGPEREIVEQIELLLIGLRRKAQAQQSQINGEEMLRYGRKHNER